MVRFLMQILPPEPFSAITPMLAAVDRTAWTGVQRRLPELGC